MNYWIGQAFGIFATIAGVSVPVFKKKWQMLVMSLANNIFGALNLVFLNAIGSGIFLFAVAAVQAVVNLVHALHNTTGKTLEKIIFVILYLGLGFYGMSQTEGVAWALSWHNALELLPVVGALMLMLSVFARGEQQARVFLLLNGMSWLVYTAVVGAAVFFSSVISVVSSAIALWKYRKGGI